MLNPDRPWKKAAFSLFPRCGPEGVVELDNSCSFTGIDKILIMG